MNDPLDENNQPPHGHDIRWSPADDGVTTVIKIDLAKLLDKGWRISTKKKIEDFLDKFKS